MPGKRLYRSREDSFLMGGCGGPGKYLEIDSNAIRLTFVLLAAWNGLGVLLYLATVLIVPEEPLPEPASPPPQPPADAQDETRRVRMLGWLLALAGAYFLVRGHPLFRPIMQDSLFPVILILGGWSSCSNGLKSGAAEALPGARDPWRPAKRAKPRNGKS